jgi:hypothetical protein
MFAKDIKLSFDYLKKYITNTNNEREREREREKERKREKSTL